MKPTIDLSLRSHRRVAILLAAASSLSISALHAADGPDPGVNSPVAGEDAIKGSEVQTPPAVIKEEPKNEAPRAEASPQMQAVLDELLALGGKPVTELSPKDARKQPSPADAVKKLMEKRDIKADKSGKTDNVRIKLSTGDLDGRVYRPDGDGPFPVILYIHGGGWVLADLDTYDSSARALSKAANAVVIATDYRHAPEHQFPAAHEDVFGAYQWTLENAGKWSGDASRVAVVGESAGGNMAVALSMMAQDKGMQMPVHQVLVYPVATTAMNSESYQQHANAAPLNAAMMKWFFDHTLSKQEDWKNHQINLLGARSLAGLPPTTIITADIDPLRSDGELLAKKLEADGVKVDYKNYEGVTHEFFGMGAVVDTAQEAVNFAAHNLKAAFADNRAAAGRPPKAGE